MLSDMDEKVRERRIMITRKKRESVPKGYGCIPTKRDSPHELSCSGLREREREREREGVVFPLTKPRLKI